MSAPPGYSENVSLLAPGTENIPGSVPVMGGGTIKGALQSIRRAVSKRQKPRVNGSKKIKKRKQRGGALTNPYVLDPANTFESALGKRSFKVDTGTTPVPKDMANAPAENTGDSTSDILSYTSSMKDMWVRTNGASAVQSLNSTIVLPLMSNPYLRPDMLTPTTLPKVGTDRLSILISDVSGIVVFPPINGDIEQFKRCISIFFSDQNRVRDSPSTCIIFPSPFFHPLYKTGDLNQNVRLFKYFLHVKNMLTKDGRHSMYILTPYTVDHISQCYDVADRLTVDDKSPVLPLLEPSYILFPYSVGIQNAAAAELSADERGGILFSAPGPGEPILPEPNSSMDGLIDLALKSSGATSIAYRPLLQTEDLKLVDMNYRQVSEFGETIQFYEIVPTPATKSLTITGPAFIGDENAFTNGVPLTAVSLGTQGYSLRTSLPDVVKDWKLAIYTNEEARLLNDLNMSPALLQKGFGTSWKEELANNLITISRSKCFTDTSLVLNADCQRTKQFISKVFEQMVQNSDSILAFQGSKADSQVASLSNIVAQQNKIINGATLAGTIPGPDLMDPNDFTDVINYITDTTGLVKPNLDLTDFVDRFNKKTYRPVLSVRNFRVISTPPTTPIKIVVAFSGLLTTKDKGLLGATQVEKDIPIKGQYTLTISKAITDTQLDALKNNNVRQFRIVKSNGPYAVDWGNNQNVPNSNISDKTFTLRINMTKNIPSTIPGIPPKVRPFNITLVMNNSSQGGSPYTDAMVKGDIRAIQELYREINTSSSILFPNYTFYEPSARL